MAKEPHFAVVVCKAFENGSRQRALQQGEASTEKIVANLFDTLALTLGQKLAVAFSLTKSQYRTVAEDALRMIATLLPMVKEVNQLKDIAEGILHGLVHLVSFTEVCTQHFARRPDL
jgi:hypothetical protein